MSQRLALVTGGTRGIGRAISELLHLQGYHVIATHHANTEVAQAFSKETGIQAYAWDVSHQKTCEESFRRLSKEVGPVDVLVNNAGITRDSIFYKMQPHQWEAVIQTNLTSCFYMCQGVIASMRERRYGRIINISSINGLKGQVGQTNYSAAKAGIIGFTKALAQETARYGITVNAIAPGYVATDMVQALDSAILQHILGQIPVGRLGKPEEIARAVLFLAAEEAGFITGATLSINGGQYL